MDDKTKISITVAGQKYNIAADDEQEAKRVKRAAIDLDERLASALKANPALTFTQALIFTALEYADIASEAIQSQKELKGEIKGYLEDAAKAKTECDRLEREITKLKKNSK